MGKLVKLSGSVGKSAKNRRKDSTIVQLKLNRYIGPGLPLSYLDKLDTKTKGSDVKTVDAISAFQRDVLSIPETGKIKGTLCQTYRALCEDVKLPGTTDHFMDLLCDCLGQAPPAAEGESTSRISEELWSVALGSMIDHLEHPLLKIYDRITLVDFTIGKKEPRMWIVNLGHSRSKVVFKTFVAHGVGSQRGKDGKWKRFKTSSQKPSVLNKAGYSSKTGAFITFSKTYKCPAGQKKVNGVKKKEKALRIHGLDSTNNHVRKIGVVIHGAHYVNGPHSVGDSWGCFATKQSHNDNEIIPRIIGGSFLYSFAGWQHQPYDFE